MAGLPINEVMTPPALPARLAAGGVVGSGFPVKNQGSIAGGLLRPGAIDQAQFKRMLLDQGAVKNQAASVPAKAEVAISRTPIPAQMAPPVGEFLDARVSVADMNALPSLTPEQFAVLVGSQDSRPPSPPVELGPAARPPVARESAVAPEVPEQALNTPPDAPVPAAAERIAPEETPNVDPRVVELSRMPDREERLALAAQGKRWHVKETPGARELFLGPDGEFGWDDFLDIINPLQHIPIISNIYRAITGDQAYSLSQFVGALPFGPLSIAGAVVDTIVRSQTGRDVGTDIAASVLGMDNRTPEEASLGLGKGDAGDNTGQVASVAPEARPDRARIYRSDRDGNDRG